MLFNNLIIYRSPIIADAYGVTDAQVLDIIEQNPSSETRMARQNTVYVFPFNRQRGIAQMSRAVAKGGFIYAEINRQPHSDSGNGNIPVGIIINTVFFQVYSG